MLERAVQLGEQHGYRNAQATVLAPTGTIGCSWIATPPASSRLRADQVQEARRGGSFKIVNQSVPGR